MFLIRAAGLAVEEQGRPDLHHDDIPAGDRARQRPFRLLVANRKIFSTGLDSRVQQRV